jgi:predicted ATP-grasp superfamily ATP-dependent carboligase
MNKTGAIIIEGHIQGLSNTRSLGEAGIPVYVVDKTNCIARYSKYCTKFFKSPEFIKDEFANFLLSLAERENIQDWVLIPSNDHAVYTISKHKNQLEQYFKVITPSLNIIHKIYDKLQLIELGNELDIPVPATQSFHSADDQLSEQLEFPVLTKGQYGLSFYKAIGKKAFLARNENELRKQLHYISNAVSITYSLTQELIPFNGNNKTISFTAFCDNGNILAHWTGVKLREHPIQFGTATFTKSTYVKACHRYSEKLLNELKYTGVCEVEFILDPRTNNYKLIEINPRTWLWVELAKASGVDYAKMIYNYANSRKLQKYKADNTTRYWINPFTDTVYSLISILKGKLNPIHYLQSLMTKNKTNAIFAKGDNKPGWVYLLNTIYFLHNR